MHFMTNIILTFLPDYKDTHYLPCIMILSCICFSLLFTKTYQNDKNKQSEIDNSIQKALGEK